MQKKTVFNFDLLIIATKVFVCTHIIIAALAHQLYRAYPRCALRTKTCSDRIDPSQTIAKTAL